MISDLACLEGTVELIEALDIMQLYDFKPYSLPYTMRGFNTVFNHALAGQGIVNAALNPAKGISTFATTGAVIPGAVPTAPGPKDVFKEGGDCKFAWTADPSGQWKEMNVQLMSGDNWNMIPVTSESPSAF